MVVTKKKVWGLDGQNLHQKITKIYDDTLIVKAERKLLASVPKTAKLFLEQTVVNFSLRIKANKTLNSSFFF